VVEFDKIGIFTEKNGEISLNCKFMLKNDVSKLIFKFKDINYFLKICKKH